MHFGQVERFIKVKNQCPPRCDSSYNKCMFYAIINVMNIYDMADVTRTTSHMHMVPLQSPTGELAVVPLQDICDVCVFASAHEDLHFVSVLPNRIEKEWSQASHLGVFRKTFYEGVLLLMFWCYIIYKDSAEKLLYILIAFIGICNCFKTIRPSVLFKKNVFDFMKMWDLHE